MKMLGEAYNFPDYYSGNLDSADEILEDRKETLGKEKLSVRPLFDVLLSDETEIERGKIWGLLSDHLELV